MRAIAVACLIGLSALAFAAPPHAAGPKNDRLLILDQRAGQYRYLDSFDNGAADAYSQALAAFGRPSRFRLTGNLCRVTWASAGVSVGFASDTHPCSTASLFRSAWYGMSLFGRTWHTQVGVRVGDSVAKVRRLYPHARFDTEAGRAWLVLARRRQDEFNFVILAVAVNRIGVVTSIEVPAAYVY